MKESIKLENYLAGKPLNDEMARLMRGDDEEADEPQARRANYADGTPITKQDREHLKRMLVSAGWHVLLKLLDTALQHQEDAARRSSLENPLARRDELAAMWAELAADKKARSRVEEMAEHEVEKLKVKKKCAIGTTKTPTVTN